MSAGTSLPADPFARTDKLDAGLLDAIAARLETRAKHPRFAAMLAQYLDAMAIDGVREVLDMGCGTGIAARAIASRPGFRGKVLGIDLSSHLAAYGARLAREEGLADRVELRAGDSRSLSLADGRFDAVVAHTLVSHVADPQSVLREAARVLRPGGTLAVFDGDYASLTFGNADPAIGKAHDEALVAAVVSSPRVMRDMPRLLRAAKLEMVSVAAHVLAEAGKADFWLSAIEAFRRLVPKAGTMSEAQADDWAAALRADSEAGVFFGSSVYYAYIARRPPR